MASPAVRFKRWRQRAKLSQDKAAKLVGCSQSMIGAIESGEKHPGIGIAVAIERETKGRIRVHEWARERGGDKTAAEVST